MSLDCDNKISLEQLREMQVKPPVKPAAPSQQRRNKWGNNPKWHDSPNVGLRHYQSTKEADYARKLDDDVAAGLIRSFQVQYPVYCGFDTAKGTPRLMKIDFRVELTDGSIEYRDTKGAKPTQDWLIKRDAVRKFHGIEIQVV